MRNGDKSASASEQFRNSQEYLEREAPRLVEARRRAGLEGLVGDLACVIINVEPDQQADAVAKFGRYTGMTLTGAYRGPNYVTAVLSLADETTRAETRGRDAHATRGQDARATSSSADILIRSRLREGENPFRQMNDYPKSRHLPNTRLETFVFEAFDLPRYVRIQKSLGVRFVTDDIVETDTYSFIQTVPSTLIGASYGFIQWHGQRGVYSFAGSEEVRWDLVNAQPTTAYRSKIGRLDHVATRLAARDRDEAILEFIRLTNHHYKFSIYVESLNSITNVTRRSERDVGLVFTSGIGQYVSDEVSGPTEKFVHNYGPRTHHMAFDTQDIEWTFGRLKEDGMEFMIELVGGPTEGLHQTFTQPSAGTLIVNEYIHRYNGFTGYFTLSNVTALTQATAKQ